MENVTAIVAVFVGVAIGFIAGYLCQRDSLKILKVRNDLLTEMNKALTDTMKQFLDADQEVENDADWWKQK